MFKTTLILITQARPTDLIRQERQRDEVRGGREVEVEVEVRVRVGVEETRLEAERGAALVSGCLKASL